jgi:copper chaperone CopZ
MKRLIKLFFLIAVVAFSTAHGMAQKPKTEITTLSIQSNMHCEDCVNKLTNYLKFEKGLKDLKVDLGSNTIKLVYKTGKNNAESITKGIRKQGYEAQEITPEQYNKMTKEQKK